MATETGPDGGSGAEPATEADLTYPAESLPGFFREHFGPSMLWALIGIGGSHVLLAPIVASVFGLFAVVIYLFLFAVRYGGWELGIRYAYGTGRNPLEGYRNLPGPSDWALWVALVNFTLIAAIIVASVGVASAGFLAALLERAGVAGVSPTAAHVGLVALAAGFVGLSRYSLLEKVLTVFTVVIFALVVVGALVGPPSARLVNETLLTVPDRPTEAWILLVVAAAGVTPAGFSNTVFIGSWMTAKEQGAGELREQGLDPDDEAHHDYIRSWIATGKRDFRIGYAFSLLLLLAMVVLAANVIFPEPLTNENFALAVGSVLSESFGPGIFFVMVAGAFAAVYSTVIALFDGASRASSRILGMVLDRDLDGEWTRRAVVGLIAIGGLAPVVALGPRTVDFALFITVTLAVVEAFYFPANWYITETELPEALRPSNAWRVYYAVSLLVVAVFAALALFRAGVLLGWLP